MLICMRQLQLLHPAVDTLVSVPSTLIYPTNKGGGSAASNPLPHGAQGCSWTSNLFRAVTPSLHPLSSRKTGVLRLLLALVGELCHHRAPSGLHKVPGARPIPSAVVGCVVYSRGSRATATEPLSRAVRQDKTEYRQETVLQWIRVSRQLLRLALRILKQQAVHIHPEVLEWFNGRILICQIHHTARPPVIQKAHLNSFEGIWAKMVLGLHHHWELGSSLDPTRRLAGASRLG
ncbi:uncharacterized protein LOC103877444 [Papio anubis]|uniref:uncharacterized protein LOC103877444 n=1 Tax=Papio anubis TaxID=9555 RepID=UPI0012AD36B7|nr:uncharacterized protein LOC103877444 [Papio anubis]